MATFLACKFFSVFSKKNSKIFFSNFFSNIFFKIVFQYFFLIKKFFLSKFVFLNFFPSIDLKKTISEKWFFQTKKQKFENWCKSFFSPITYLNEKKINSKCHSLVETARDPPYIVHITCIYVTNRIMR